MCGVVSEHFLDRLKLSLHQGLMRVMDFLGLLLLKTGAMKGRFHGVGSFEFLEGDAEGFSGTMQFTSDGVPALTRKRADLLVAQFLISDEKQEQPIFLWNGVERLLNPFAKFLGFQDAQRMIIRRTRGLPDAVIRVGKHMALVPRLPQVLAMVDRDFVKPRPDGGLATELIHLVERL